MARIRTIKPDAFKSYSLAQVPRGLRWTFAGLWTYADDSGRGRDDVRLIKAEIYPIDDEVSLSILSDDLEQLEKVGCICRYEVEGRAYFHIPGWPHQKISHPTPSKLPTCSRHDPGSSGAAPESFVKPPEPLRPERKGKERNREQGREGIAEAADAPSDDDEGDDVPPVEDDRPDVERVCKHLQKSMVDLGYPRPAITERWRDAARLLMGRDKRTEEEVHGAIDWAHDNEFWRANIKSMPTLRKQFTTLYLQAKAELDKANKRTGPSRSATDDADEQTRRFLERHGGAA